MCYFFFSFVVAFRTDKFFVTYLVIFRHDMQRKSEFLRFYAFHTPHSTQESPCLLRERENVLVITRDAWKGPIIVRDSILQRGIGDPGLLSRYRRGVTSPRRIELTCRQGTSFIICGHSKKAFWKVFAKHFDLPLVAKDISDANTITFAETFVFRCQMYKKSENSLDLDYVMLVGKVSSSEKLPSTRSSDNWRVATTKPRCGARKHRISQLPILPN